jgi:hypothetical protein
MEFSSHDFVSVNEILSDVTAVVHDREFSMMSKGWYTSQVQQALHELSFDTVFDEKRVVIPVPSDLRAELPSGAFNIKEIYLFNGTECDIASSQRVWYKKNHFTAGSGRISNGNDPFFGNVNEPNIFYADMYNGMIVLSSNCRIYQNLFVVYNGVGCEVGAVPVVPLFLREVTKLWVSDKAFEIRQAQSIGTSEFSQWRAMKSDNYVKLKGGNYSEWDKAELRVKSMGTKARRDFKEYLTRMGY